MTAVLVTHPGRQHSHQAAMALERAGLLAGYWSGVPSREPQQRVLPRFIRGTLHRYAPADLPDGKTRWLPFPVVLRRAGRLAPRAVEQPIDFLACRGFDWQVAARLARTGAAAVMACEISALSTFRAARAAGMQTILDAASVHYTVQDRVTPRPEAEWLHRRIVDVKRREIELADHILTVSQLARDGYVEAGCAPERVHALALGADLSLFSPEARPRDTSGPCVFVFAGATIHRKGFDVLLEAFAALERKLPGRSRLAVVGPRGDSHALLERAPGAIESVGPVPQSRLAEIFRGADCFVLPSRHDSFGMVVVEALASGVPAIVSNMVGAKDAIDEGRSGWVVPFGDAAALASRMAWCVENRRELADMRAAARACAERLSWERYAAQLASLVRHLLAA